MQYKTTKWSWHLFTLWIPGFLHSKTIQRLFLQLFWIADLKFRWCKPVKVINEKLTNLNLNIYINSWWFIAPPPRKVHLHSKKRIFLNFLSPQNEGEKNYIRTNHWKRCLLRGRYCKDVRQSTYILWSESLQVFLTFHDGTKIPSCTSNVSETFQCSWKKNLRPVRCRLNDSTFEILMMPNWTKNC